MIIRRAEAEDDERIIGIYNSLRPGKPPISVELYQHDYRNIPESARSERWVADQDGEIDGYAHLEENRMASREGVFRVWLEVALDRRRRGIGARLYQEVADCCRDLRAARLYGEVREGDDESMRFAERRGFTETGHIERESRLDVRKANLEGYEAIDDRMREQGIRIRTWAEIGTDDEAFNRKLHHVEAEAESDVPSSEELDQQGFEFDWWLQRQLGMPDRSPECVWIALDGADPVGLARLNLRGGAAFNGFTGVLRAYRGRGIARALKLRTIEWARANGVNFIYTGNDVENRRMLAINVRLGYEPLPSQIEVVKELGFDISSSYREASSE